MPLCSMGVVGRGEKPWSLASFFLSFFFLSLSLTHSHTQTRANLKRHWVSHAYVDTHARVPPVCPDPYSLVIGTLPCTHAFVCYQISCGTDSSHVVDISKRSLITKWVLYICACEKEASRCSTADVAHSFLAYLGQRKDHLNELWLFL